MCFKAVQHIFWFFKVVFFCFLSEFGCSVSAEHLHHSEVTPASDCDWPGGGWKGQWNLSRVTGSGFNGLQPSLKETVNLHLPAHVYINHVPDSLPC